MKFLGCIRSKTRGTRSATSCYAKDLVLWIREPNLRFIRGHELVSVLHQERLHVFRLSLAAREFQVVSCNRQVGEHRPDVSALLFGPTDEEHVGLFRGLLTRDRKQVEVLLRLRD